MSDKEFQEAYRNLSEKEKDLYESLLRLGDEEKIALVTVLNESKKPKYDKVTWDLHRYAKGGEMAKGGITPQLNDKVHAKALRIFAILSLKSTSPPSAIKSPLFCFVFIFVIFIRSL